MSDKPEISVHLIRLVDGTLIDPLTRAPVVHPPRASDAPSDSEIGSDDVSSSIGVIAPLTRRSILDLTLNAQQMAVVNNVLVYTLWGLPDDEIAMQCNCTTEEVQVVRDLKEYTDMHDALIAGMRASYTASAHGIISRSAVAAANVVVGNLKSGSKSMQFDAARDILDRSGHRPADHAAINVTLNKGEDDHLVIRVVRESERPHIPSYDMNGTRTDGS